jgi:predicted ATPase/DNA-binding SARP family transcriptional activator
MLRLQCLGDLTVAVDGVTLPALTNSKAAALWLYVAMTGASCSRALLARVFWGELDDAAARANLRVLLSRLRLDLPDHLHADRTTVSLPAEAVWDLGLGALDPAASGEDDALPALLGLRVEDFLCGLRLRKAPEFEDWLSAQREQLCQRYLERLDHAAVKLHLAGDFRKEAEVLRRCLSVAPWSEPHHRALIRIYVELEQRASAIGQYEACSKALRRELDASPSAETRALYEAALQIDVTEARPSPAQQPVAGEPFDTGGPGRSLPFDASVPWVGRNDDVGRIGELLLTADARVVSVTGPGGIGKTHLALAVGAALRARFPDGVCFVDLSDLAPQAGANSGIVVAHRIAAAMGTALPAGREREYLIELFVRGRQLLILDNFEQLADAAYIVAMLARHASGLRILVTSRHLLGLPTEWVVKLAGLAFPDADRWSPAMRRVPAIELFCELASRQHPDFDIDAHGDSILRICRAVDGYPLGLVLAVRALAVLSCSELADRLSQGVGMLGATSASPGANPRHADMSVVFDHSWRLLAREEQDALGALCIFRGGFTAESALAVTGSTLAVLAGLTAKSLLRRASDERLDVHPLLRDFGERKLRAAAAERTVRDAHAQYFMARLQSAASLFAERSDTSALDSLCDEQGNLRVVFDHLVASDAVDQLARLLPGLWALYRLQGWFEQVVGFLERALTVPGLSPATAATCRLWLSAALFQLGRHGECRNAALECLSGYGEPTFEGGMPTAHMVKELLRAVAGRRRRYASLDVAAIGNVSRAHNRLAQVYFYEGDRPRFVASTLRSINLDGAESCPANLASGALVLSYTPFRAAAARYAARAARALDGAGMPEQAWAHEQLCLYWLASGELELAASHGRAGAALFGKLRQHRNWGECAALSAYAHEFGGRLSEAREDMRALRDEGRRLREAASELWGSLALCEIDLRIAAAAPELDLRAIDKLAAAVVDPNSQLLRHGVLAWWYARCGRVADALAAVDLFCRVCDRASMTSIYALNGFSSGAMALVELSVQSQAERAALSAQGKRLFRAAHRFAHALPGARPRIDYLQGLWWVATGRRRRGEGAIARVLGRLPAGPDREGFLAGFQLPQQKVR